MSPGVPTRPALVASAPFAPSLDSRRVAAAVGRGLLAGGLPAPDLCPLPSAGRPDGGVQELLATLGFDERMLRARAVILVVEQLSRETLLGSVACEVATRARQGGVPAYAVARESSLDLFDARILDLQVILRAGGARSLQAAGRRLAEII